MTRLASAYTRERLWTVPVLAASALLGLAALPRSASSAGQLAATAFLLVAQFRIWDDIEDLAVDARRAPRRALTRAQSIAPAVRLAIVFATGTIVLLARMPGRRDALVAYAGLALGLLVYYRVRRLGGIAVLLLKYPAIALILCAAHGDSLRATTPAMALAYAAACSFEYLHDGQSSGLSRETVLLLHALSLTATFVVSRMW